MCLLHNTSNDYTFIRYPLCNESVSEPKSRTFPRCSRDVRSAKILEISVSRIIIWTSSFLTDTFKRSRSLATFSSTFFSYICQPWSSLSLTDRSYILLSLPHNPWLCQVIFIYFLSRQLLSNAIRIATSISIGFIVRRQFPHSINSNPHSQPMSDRRPKN